jgi:outer membrane protein OmpA-like peptidoglycan-associated protein
MKAALLLFALVAADAREAVRFVACPVYRDTDAGKKSGCWLAEDPASGVRYDITSSPTKADWNHAVLVEGFVAQGQGDPCGGVVLDPVRVSVLEQGCTRHMLPAEGFPGRKFALPKRNVRPLYEERVKPAKPFAARNFVIPFDHGSSFVTYQLSDYYLDAAINYALDVQPATVTITGYAATSPERVSGFDLSEPRALAKTRADAMARAFQLRGVAVARVSTGRESSSTDEAFDGLIAPSLRRVEISIEPKQ